MFIKFLFYVSKKICRKKIKKQACIQAGRVKILNEGKLKRGDALSLKVKYHTKRTLHLVFDNLTLLGSDNTGEQPFTPGNNYNLSLQWR